MFGFPPKQQGGKKAAGNWQPPIVFIAKMYEEGYGSLVDFLFIVVQLNLTWFVSHNIPKKI